MTSGGHTPAIIAASRSRWVHSDLVAMLGISVAWALAATVCQASGDYALNDDWAYALMVRRFLESGRIEPTSWTFTTTISNVWLGALFASVFGFSNVVLRASTLFAGWLCGLLTFATLRRLGQPREHALLGTAVVVLNPIFFNLSNTFMTDVGFVAFQSIALFGLSLLITGPRVLGAALALVGVTLAVLSRQPAVMLPVAMAGVAALRFVPTRRAAAWFLLSGLTLGVVLFLVLRNVEPPGVALRVLHEALASPNLPFFVARNLVRTAVFGGLCVVVLLPALVSFSTRAERTELFAAVLLTTLLMLAASGHGLTPSFGSNTIQPGGLGPLVVHGHALRQELPSALFWGASFVATLSVALTVIRVGRALVRRPWQDVRVDRPTLFVVLYCALYAAPALTRPTYFDRYLLPLAPGVVVAALLLFGRQLSRGRLNLAWCLSGLLGAYAIAGTRDYLTHHSLRSQLIRVALNSGAEPALIEGGFEFAGAANFDDVDPDAMERTRREGHESVGLAAYYTLIERTSDILHAAPDEWPHPHRFVVSESSHIDGFDRVAARSAPRWLPPSQETLYLHERHTAR